MPTYAAPSTSNVELRDFRGTDGSADDFGFPELRSWKRLPGVTWGNTPRVDEYIDSQGRTAVAGDVYARQAAVVGFDASDDPIYSYGTWVHVGEMRTPEGREKLAREYVFTRPGRDSRSAPEAPMRNPLGLRMYDAEGALVTRPAVGEQDLDDRTGEPLVDDQGAPVLVEGAK